MIAAIKQRFFHGRVLRVHSIDRIEVFVDLGFEVSVRKTFRLDALGFDVCGLTDDQLSKAQHALVILLGGKKVIVEPELSQREKWGHHPDLRARVYVAERIYGRPLGLTNGILRDPVLEVSPFFSYVAENGFALPLVKRVLNGGGKRG